MKELNLKGIIAYPITPFSACGERIDGDTLGLLIDRLIDSGCHAIAPLGSTGESAYLNDKEWDEVAERSLSQVNRRVPVIVGISDLTTQNAIRRARFAQAHGADAVMVLPVSYWKLSEREIYRHYSRIAQAIDIPIMLYNNPATSGVDMSPELIARIVREVDNVTMVKESTGDIQRMHRLAQLSDRRIPMYNGSNPLALEAFAAGAVGWCTAAPNLIPALNLRLYEAALAGDLQQARDLFYRQLPLLQFILKGGLPTTIKAGLTLCGIDAGAPRLPLEALDEAETERLAAILDTLR
ncbi:dihydrodipicolinate synthase family protein [Pseudomonas indica]|uniref:dihydrodipicolinate synthase family protein n=1 Tax=Pseudomonas indica TaxID=137658 RepID=UPI000BABA60D|nr:dihydrodipicolinate synthase family protein [Pseudomonas indica]PAU63770.1 dihydrodipicolinate synthase family protein [Pseudomonas indica]